MGDHFRDDVQLTMKIFDTVISPILTYGSEVWGVDHDGKLENDPIEFVQTKFIRWLLGVNKFCSSNACRSAQISKSTLPCLPERYVSIFFLQYGEVRGGRPFPNANEDKVQSH